MTKQSFIFDEIIFNHLKADAKNKETVQELIDNNNGKSFSQPLIYVGYTLIIFGLYTLINAIVPGLIVTLIGIFIGFSSTGLTLNPNTKEFREYTIMFGIRVGKWQSLENYPDLSLLKRTIGYSALSRGQRELSDSDSYIDICLLSKSHRKKILVKRMQNKEEALIDAKLIAEKMGLNLTAYAPKVSNRSRMNKAKMNNPNR